jgi:superfamily II DNA or RNA helicase
MNIRDLRQKEAVEAFLASDRKSIVNACPRFGKIKVAIEIMKALGVRNPMILAPRKDIEKGWKDDFQKFGVTGGYEFRTFASIKKILGFSHQILIIDEPHELSVNQQKALQRHVDTCPHVLGLTGTMTQKTRIELYDNLTLDVCFKYTIDQGVSEGILADYEMFIHRVPLDNTKLIYTSSKGKDYTEKGWFMALQRVANSRPFMDLKLINILQKSIAKIQKTKELIRKGGSDRVLVFCGVTEVADKLGIDVYHSKAKEHDLFLDFCVGGPGGTNQLATIKMMQAGITINPIHRGIINYMSGNPEDSAQKICRFLGLEYDNPNKKAEIHIVSSDEEFEIGRLKTGLAFFDPKKITIINEKKIKEN